MNIYLAGEGFLYHHWRHEVVRQKPGSTALLYSVEDRDTPVLSKTIRGAHNYTGPYFNGSNIQPGNPHYYGPPELRASCGTVCNERLLGILRADLVFAWVNSRKSAPDSFEVCAELGFAKGYGKQIVIAGPKRFDELWFVYQLADQFIPSPDAVTALNNYLDSVEPATPSAKPGEVNEWR